MVVEIEEVTQDVYNITVETVNPDMVETLERIEDLVEDAELASSQASVSANNASQSASQANSALQGSESASASAQNSASQARGYRDEAKSYAESAAEGGSASWDSLEGKPSVIGAGDTAQEAREAIGAGTSNLAIGNTETTAKAGDWIPNWSSDITDMPTFIASGSTAEEARNSIGAGTSNYVFPSGGTSSQFVLGDNTLLARSEILPILSSYEFKNPATNHNARVVSGNSLNRDITDKMNTWVYTQVNGTAQRLTLAHFNANNTVVINMADSHIIIPNNTNVAVPIGCMKEFVNINATELAIHGEASLTVNRQAVTVGMPIMTIPPNTSFKLWKVGTNTWYITL